MKFRLGQKVGYKRISKKIEIDMQYWVVDDFEEDEEKGLERREFIELEKERIGYVMGRRKLVSITYFQVFTDNGDNFEPATEFVGITKQKYQYFYVVAYTMGKTNYALEEDLEED